MELQLETIHKQLLQHEICFVFRRAWMDRGLDVEPARFQPARPLDLIWPHVMSSLDEALQRDGGNPDPLGVAGAWAAASGQGTDEPRSGLETTDRHRSRGLDGCRLERGQSILSKNGATDEYQASRDACSQH